MVVAIVDTGIPRSLARWRFTSTRSSGFDFSRLFSMSAVPGILRIASTRPREILSSSSISGPRTLIWIGFWPNAPASVSPNERPGTCSTFWRACRSTALNVPPRCAFSFTYVVPSVTGRKFDPASPMVV
jgi:hypothetical protein